MPAHLSPQVSPTRNGPENMDDENSGEIDPNIPDASDWTTEQVYQYFARLFPKEAEIFRIQVHNFTKILNVISAIIISIKFLILFISFFSKLMDIHYYY